MSVLRPRNKIVYFRVSEEEFDRYSDLCRAYGARSLSELLRSAMDMLQNRDGNGGDLSARLAELGRMLTLLNDKLDRLGIESTMVGDGTCVERKDNRS